MARQVRGYRDEILTHSYGTVSSQTQLYTTAMLGLGAGYLTKFDDTGAYTFFGLVNEHEGNPVVPTDGTTSATAGAATWRRRVRADSPGWPSPTSAAWSTPSTTRRGPWTQAPRSTPIASAWSRT